MTLLIEFSQCTPVRSELDINPPNIVVPDLHKS